MMTSGPAFDAILERMMLRGGIRERDHAERVLAAALEILAERLGPGDAEALGRILPPRMSHVLTAPLGRGNPSTTELFEHAAVRTGIAYGAAVEQVSSALEATAAFLDAEALVTLRRRLPDEWAGLFTESEANSDFVPLRGTVAGHGHTLATGRPGGSHPLSEARPPSAQSDSVVGADNPHGDRKLSSGHPDAVEESLASGRPGAEVSLADSRDGR